MVIGADYFSNLGFSISVPNLKFSFGPSGKAAPPPFYSRIGMSGSVPQVRVMVGSQPLMMAVDLGFNGDLALSKEAWTKVKPTVQSVGGLDASLDGTVRSVRSGLVTEFTLGDMTFRNITVCDCVFSEKLGDGVIGVGLLGLSPFILDEGNKTLWIVPSRKAPSRVVGDQGVKK